MLDQPALPDLTVRAIRAVPVEVPLNFVLETSQGTFSRVPLLLIDLTPTGHYLEYVDLADVLMEEPLVITGGQAQVPQRPGQGMARNKTAVEHHRMR